MIKRKAIVQKAPSIYYGPPSRNRQDILDQVKDEAVKTNSFQVHGHYLTWHTTPDELIRIATKFEGSCQEEGDGCYVSGGRYGLTLYRPGTIGLEISTSSSYYPTVSLWVRPSALKRAAKRLSLASWDKRPKGHEDQYGCDRKTIKLRVGDDIITLIWTPELDQKGVPQISQMVWDAWGVRFERNFAQKSQQRRSRRISLLRGIKNDVFSV